MRLTTQLLTTCILLMFSSLSVAMQVDSVAGSASGGTEVPTGPDLATQQGGGLTLDQAVQQVRRQYPGGKIVSAETQGGTHVIKVLTAEGTVRTVRISAR